MRDILDIEIEIDEVETEKSFDPLVGYVATKYDLYAEDKKNRIIVDIQHERYPDHYDRFLHYHCAAILQQVGNSYNYRPNLKVFTLVVLTSGDRHKNDISIIDFDPKDLIIPHERARMFNEYNRELLKQEVSDKAHAAGEIEGQKKTARNLLMLGVLSVEQIAQAANLTTAQVIALRDAG